MNQQEENNNTLKRNTSKKFLIRVILVLFFCILAVLLCRACAGRHSGIGVSETTGVPDRKPGTTPPLEFEDENPWDGDTSTTFTDSAELEYTTYPGFTEIKVNKKHREIQLYNPPENTVYFVYKVIDTATGDEVFGTKAIAPGNSIKWNVYDTVGVGRHKINIEIFTYDVTTQKQCYGTTNTVDVTVY